MKMKRILAAICLAAAFAITGCADKNTADPDAGQQVSSEAADIAAVVNGQPISKERFETYKSGLSDAQGNFTDAQVLDQLIRREVVQQEIARLGITITDEEVRQFNEERFALLDDDPAAYQLMQDYVDGLGITMEEYKEQSLAISRESLLYDRYRERMQAEYQKAGTKESFEDYLNERIDALVQEAQIEINL